MKPVPAGGIAGTRRRINNRLVAVFAGVLQLGNLARQGINQLLLFLQLLLQLLVLLEQQDWICSWVTGGSSAQKPARAASKIRATQLPHANLVFRAAVMRDIQQLTCLPMCFGLG